MVFINTSNNNNGENYGNGHKLEYKYFSIAFHQIFYKLFQISDYILKQ